MRLKLLLTTIGVLTIFACRAQIILQGDELKDRERLKRTQVVGGQVIGSDTILRVKHAPITIMPARKFKNEREKKYYYKLVYNIKKVLPYAYIIRKVYAEIEDSLAKIPDPILQKEYLKNEEALLMAKFEKQLIKLTVSQGRILIKLVDRETGHSTYEVIKEFRGGFSAFMWQGVARLFGSNLKSEYDPDEEDKMIEEIIHLIENGML